MGYNTTYRTAAQLTAEARAAADVAHSGFLLSQFLPNRDNPGLSFDFDLNVLTLPDAATFRSFDTEAPLGTTVGTQNRAGKLPPISRKLRVTEYDQLSLYGADDAIGEKVDSYARRLGAGIEARLELARGQAVETGVVTINENKLKFTIDYGRKGAHTVTAGTLWSTLSAPAPTNLLSWQATYNATNGYNWGVAMMSTQTLLYLQQNTAIIGAVVGRGSSDLPSMISRDQVQAYFTAYGFGRIILTDDTPQKATVSVSGTPTRILSQNKITFAPEPTTLEGTGSLGGTDWGIPSEAIQLKYGIPEAERAGIFAACLDQEDPESINVLDSAIALPILENANATFTATVS